MTQVLICELRFRIISEHCPPHCHLSGAVIGLAAGALTMTCVMLLWNYLITPLYLGYSREAVAKLLLPAFLPFNLIKSGLNAALTFLLYKPVITALRKSGYISAGSSGPGERHMGMILVAAAVGLACILPILSMIGVI